MIMKRTSTCKVRRASHTVKFGCDSIFYGFSVSSTWGCGGGEEES